MAVIALKSMCVISTELRQIGYSLSDTTKAFTSPEKNITSQPVV